METFAHASDIWDPTASTLIIPIYRPPSPLPTTKIISMIIICLTHFSYLHWLSTIIKLVSSIFETNTQIELISKQTSSGRKYKHFIRIMVSAGLCKLFIIKKWKEKLAIHKIDFNSINNEPKSTHRYWEELIRKHIIYHFFILRFINRRNRFVNGVQFDIIFCHRDSCAFNE